MTQALQPWGFVFEETQFQAGSAKLGDSVITFQREGTSPPPQMRVAVRWRSLTVSIDQLDWSEAESFIQLCKAAVAKVLEIAGVGVQSQQITLAMHVQSKTTLRNELTSLFLTPQARELMGDGSIVGQGLILHREKAMILIDNSTGFANGLFIRMQRTFDRGVGMEQISEVLLADEKKLWDTLGLEGEL